MDALSERKGYTGTERRSNKDRRVSVDQRTNIRFDESGGDRRSGSGRRSIDEGLEVIGVDE